MDNMYSHLIGKLQNFGEFMDRGKGQIAVLFLVLALLLLVAGPLLEHGLALTPDSLAYREAALNFRAGHGLSLQRLVLQEPSSYTAFTTWPPLYPSLISLVMALTKLNVDGAATLVSHISIALSGFTLYLLSRYAMNSAFAFLLVAIFVFHTATLTVYAYMWSEGIFLTFVLVTLLFALKSGECLRLSRYRSGYSYLLASIAFAVLATYTKYIGAVFIVLPLTSAYFSGSCLKGRARKSAAIIVVYGIAMLPLFARNYYKSGYLSGANRPDSSKPLSENLSDFIASLKDQFLDFGPTGTILFLAVIVTVATILGLDYLRETHLASARKKVSRNFTVYAAAGFLVYGILIIALRTWKEFDAIDTRLISPLVVFALLLLFSINIHVSEYYPILIKRIFVLLPILVFSVLSITKGYSALSNTRDAWRNIGSPEFYANSSAAYSNYNNFRYKKMLRDTKDRLSGKNKSIAIISDRPGIVGYLLDQPVYQFPEGQLDENKVALVNRKGKNGAIMLMTLRGVSSLRKSYGAKLERLNQESLQKLPGLLVITLPLPSPGT